MPGQTSHSLLDLSGVEFIDTRIAHELLRTVKAIKITGTAVKLTGIRPEIAQTFVKLRVNLNDIQVFFKPSSGIVDKEQEKGEAETASLFFAKNESFLSAFRLLY
ncbi:STAS domain-containing protein [Bacillus infantis]|uniref:STAS domain-containing protein n=1 Tax=Bacillus infantis TaxID=324767 RepID=UPI003CF67318